MIDSREHRPSQEICHSREIAGSVAPEILFLCSHDTASRLSTQSQAPMRKSRRHVVMKITASLHNQPNETYV
jgi:hypothetical protein